MEGGGEGRERMDGAMSEGEGEQEEGKREGEKPGHFLKQFGQHKKRSVI